MKTLHLIDFFNWIWLLFIVLTIIGIISKPEIYNYISFTVKILISLFLMYKFNDFRTIIEFTELDKRICFMAGTNLFIIACGDYINKIIEFAKMEIKKLELTFFKK
jgi:hypothetical protein